MSEASRSEIGSGEAKIQSKSTWNHHPELPIQNAKIFVWPPNPFVIARNLASFWLAITGRTVILIVAIVSWIYTQPVLASCMNFEFGWIAQIYLRNLILLTVFAGGLHLYFYTFTKQGERLKFDARPMRRNGRVFTFHDQVLDNMFWSLASGVFFWSLFEVLFMWAYANNYLSVLNWSDSPVWFVAIFLLIPLWYSFYFYWIHRMLHWPPLYRAVHSLHHRNVNVGPWSGASMHPVEHFFYLGSVLIHLIVPSHPLHVIFHLQFNVLIAVITHCGFESLLAGGEKRMDLGYFFHQLHHRYFECNYGTDEMPWDKWFGTFHNGTEEATKEIRERRSKMFAVD